MKKICFLILIMLVFLLSCQTNENDDDIIYMLSNNSYHPIYVRGNKNASTYILWVHGGPGSSGIYYGDIPEVAQLHENYRVVYFDQLSSGATVGNPSVDDFTISEFTSHIDGVYNIIKNRYSPDKMYILGHSWGAFLSASYLIAEGDESLAKERQSNYEGFININAVMDIQQTLTNGIEYIYNFASNSINSNVDVAKWQKAINWYDEKDGIFLGSDVATHYDYINDAGGMCVNKERVDYITAILTIEMVLKVCHRCK